MRTKKFKSIEDAVAFASDYIFDGTDEESESNHDSDSDSEFGSDSSDGSEFKDVPGKFRKARAEFEKVCTELLNKKQAVVAGIGEEDDILEDIMMGAGFSLITFSSKLYIRIEPNLEVEYHPF